MSSVNKVIIIGNLGQDPEMRYLDGGSPVCNLSIATARKWKDKNSGEFKEEVEWHKCSVFGKTAENCGQYLVKGKQVYIEGRIKTRSWDDKDGIKRYSTEIVAEQVTFLGGREGGGQRGDSGGNRGGGRQSGSGGPEPYDPGSYSSDRPEDDDSCPF